MTASKGRKILVVDDESSMREYVSEVLSDAGYECLSVESGMRALSCLADTDDIDLVLSDISMPGISGMELLKSVKTVTPDMPFVLVSGLYELAIAIDALKAGATDYLYKPVRPDSLVSMVERHLQPGSENERQAMQSALARYLEQNAGAQLSTQQILEIFNVLGFNRVETMEHSRRVSAYSLALGTTQGLDQGAMNDLRLGALLHDIGKIAVPHNVLNKPGKLSAEEYDVIKLHPTIGWELLLPFPELRVSAEIVYAHHERVDGGGYPRGLEHDEIPLAARIFTIIDTYDAIVSHRPYRSADTSANAKAEIFGHAGTQFDRHLTEAFLSIPDQQLDEIRQRYVDPATSS